MTHIELKNLRKEFVGSVVAVKNLNLTVEHGEFLVLVGPSGCGKTTTLRMIAGFEDPTVGEILVDDEIINELEPAERNLGMVFQTHALFPHKTVSENIAFGPRMKKVNKDVIDKKVKLFNDYFLEQCTPITNNSILPIFNLNTISNLDTIEKNQKLY